MMTLRSSFLVLAVSALLGAPGCTVAAPLGDGDGEEEEVVGADPSEPGDAPPVDDDDTTSVPQGPGGTKGIITGNGAHPLTPTLLALWAPVARPLANGPLSPVTLAVSELLADLDGRTFLEYAIKCALPAGESLSAIHFGVTYTFKGHVGVAPEWGKSALSESSRRWLSACILAHVNAESKHVNILLRGEHPALQVPEGSSTGPFTLREGAFYGDLFALVPSKYACAGEGTTSERACTNSVAGLSPCGFSVPGECVGEAEESVCEGIHEGAYETCHSSPLLPVLPTTPYAETITVYLQP